MKNKNISILVNYSLMILLLTLIYTPLNIMAKTTINSLTEEELGEKNPERCKSWVEGELKEGFEVDYEKRTVKNKTGIEWKIIKKNDTDVDIKIPVGGTYTVSESEFNKRDDVTLLNSVTLKLVPNDELLEYKDKDYTCYMRSEDVWTTVSFALGANLGKQGNTVCPNAPTSTDVANLKLTSLDCDNPASITNTFAEKFCETKKAAVAAGAGHIYNMNDSSIANVSATAAGTKFKNTYIISNDLECAYDVNDRTKVPLAPEELKGDNYFVNNQSFYAEHVQEISRTYIHYYSPGQKTNGKTVTCKRVCAEAVSVEYGPPVAKKAGMSFEYKVRVTSRVDCHADTSSFPEPPDCDCSYCTPAPTCAHYSGDSVWYGPRAGPNNNYNACIQQCDQGKYSKKCSNKCYKEVYANKSSNNSTGEFDAQQMAAAYGSLAQCKELNQNGCYYRKDNGIYWSSYTSSNQPGRYYYETGLATNVGCSAGQFCPDWNGFLRLVGSDGNVCGATCWWLQNCGKNDYLNPKVAEKDCENNTTMWKDLVKECNEKATCNTTTAYYTIGAGYNDTEIIFPRGSTDKVTDGDYTKGKTKTTSASQAKTTLLPNFPEPESEHNGIQGCYDWDRNYDPIPNRLYRTTWGFPSTWMNAKTGEISYDSQTGQTGWAEYIRRFVIPFDQKAVNSDWWNLFYNKHLGELGVMSLNLPAVQTECLDEGGNTVITPNPNVKIEKWNINAHTRKFGWYEWNFDIKCFYATNPKPLSSTTSTSTTNTTKCDSNKDNVRVRSVDLENLFPAEDGSSLASTSSTGRQPGFNWSEYATQNKNVGYSSEPAKLTAYIQETGYKIYDDAAYSDKYLDYKFVLTPSSIRSMRGKNDGSDATGNYTGFAESGFFLDENGVQRYYSSKIRRLSDSVVPEKKWLKCNNLGDYRTGCYTP